MLAILARCRCHAHVDNSQTGLIVKRAVSCDLGGVRLRQAWLGGLIALVGTAHCGGDDTTGGPTASGGAGGGAAGRANEAGGTTTNGISGSYGAGVTAVNGGTGGDGTGGDGTGGTGTGGRGAGGAGTGGQSGSSSTGGSGGSIAIDGGGSPDSSAARACTKGVKPDATNTGVPKGVTLTVVNGDVNVTKDGTTIDLQD